MDKDSAIKLLQESHVHFCTPCYGGNVMEPCFRSYLRLTMQNMTHNLKFSVDTIVNDSLVTRARNNLVAKFLDNKEATHLMFIDADIQFVPEAVYRLIMHDKDVVVGLYPSKSLPVKYVLNIKPGGKTEGTLFEVTTAGTGFMLIKRSVIEELIAAMPETKYKDAVGLGQYEEHMYALFDTSIDKDQNYLSEDWTFCKRVQEVLGKTIWADKDIRLDHIGLYAYNGNPEEIHALSDQWAKASTVEDQKKAYDE